ncbi:MAG: GNAT family N-acetyltransferase [Candidatus Nomurabacteria bacterium]|nr:MAG: GNAT family N-acetyltransferase [Candidatus Nomurabacteria bacterium]
MPTQSEHIHERYGDDSYRSVELRNPEELREFALAFRQYYGKSIADVTQEEKEVDALTERLLEQQKDSAASVRFYGMRYGTKLVATGRLKVSTDPSTGERVALLSHLSVDPDHRGKKISTRLSVERIAEAQHLGASRILAHVAQHNVASLSLKLREGFQVTGFVYYDAAKQHGRFELSQNLPSNKAGSVSFEQREVLLSDTKTLDELLHSDWVGIALRGTREEPSLEIRKHLSSQ